MEAQVKKIDLPDQNIYAGFDAHLNTWKVILWQKILYIKTFYTAS